MQELLAAIAVNNRVIEAAPSFGELDRRLARIRRYHASNQWGR